MPARLLKVNFPKIAAGIFLFFITGIILFFTFLPNYTKIKDLKKQNEVISVHIKDLENQNQRLKEDVSSLKEDTYYLEKIAREQLGALKENEVAIKIEE